MFMVITRNVISCCMFSGVVIIILSYYLSRCVILINLLKLRLKFWENIVLSPK